MDALAAVVGVGLVAGAWPPPLLPDLHLVAAGGWRTGCGKQTVQRPITRRASSRRGLTPPARTNTFVIQCDNGVESVRAFSSVPVDSGSWHTIETSFCFRRRAAGVRTATL